MSRNLMVLLLVAGVLLPGTALAKTFGKGVTLAEVTPVSAILDAPQQYVGKTVKVAGLIVDVCTGRGCWLAVAGDRPFEQLRVKVEDGEIVFPLEARGREGEMEGVVEVFELTREQVIKQRQHHAEERGENFDPASVTAGETVVRLRGLGAEIPGL